MKLERPRPVHIIPVGLVFVVVVTVLAVYSLVSPRTTSFNVTATTERVEMMVESAPRSRWVFEDVDMAEGWADTTVRFSGSFMVAPPARVLIERVALGPLWVHVECDAPAGECESVGRLFDTAGDPVRRAGRLIEFWITDLTARAEAGRTVVLPLSGRVASGREVGIETLGSTAILRSGQVTMLGRSITGDNVFRSGEAELQAGDRFEVEAAASPDPTLGFVVADERPGLTAAYRVIGERGVVIRPGGGSYTISASWLGRLFADDWFRAVSAVFAAAVAIATLLTFLIETWNLVKPASRAAVASGPAGWLPAPPDPRPDPQHVPGDGRDRPEADVVPAPHKESS